MLVDIWSIFLKTFYGSNLVLIAIENFSQHASILKIKQARNCSDYFSFSTTEDIFKEIL